MILGFDDKTFFNNTAGIKLCTTEAGYGKTYEANAAFRAAGIPDEDVLFLGTTNAVANMIANKYNRETATACSGLFVNDYPKLYISDKLPAQHHIVCDEVFQNGTEVFAWALRHCDEYNIILLGDHHQTLPQGMTLDFINEFMSNPNVVVSNPRGVKRTSDPLTLKFYEYWYDESLKGTLYSPADIHQVFDELGYYMDVKQFDDMVFNEGKDVIICNTNVAEDYTYRALQLSSKPCDNIINKGKAANSKAKTYRPVSQITAEKMGSNAAYGQRADVADTERFQGNEVEDDGILHWVLHPTSLVPACKIYTIVTRCKNIRSLEEVLLDKKRCEREEIHAFMGKPIKKAAILRIDYEGDTTCLDGNEMRALRAQYPDTDEYSYSNDYVLRKKKYNNLPVIAFYRNDESSIDGIFKYYIVQRGEYVLIDKSRKGSNISSAWSLAKHEGDWKFSFMPELYKVLEANKIDCMAPLNIRTGRDDTAKYDVDFSGSYPQLMKYFDMPCDGILKYDQPHDDMINYYAYVNPYSEGFYGDIYHKYLSGKLCNDELKDYIEASHRLDGTSIKFKYLFSVPKKQGCYPGNYLYAKYHQSEEVKAKYKNATKFGSLNKHYLTESEDSSCYVVNEAFTYELIYLRVISLQSYFMLKLYDELNAQGLEPTEIKADSVHYHVNDPAKAITAANNAFDDVLEWKVEDLNYDKDEPARIQYRKGLALMSAKERKLEQQRARRAANKDEVNAKQRAYRAAKKLEKEAEVC